MHLPYPEQPFQNPKQKYSDPKGNGALTDNNTTPKKNQNTPKAKRSGRYSTLILECSFLNILGVSPMIFLKAAENLLSFS